MHNTPLANAEFELQCNITNLRYLLGSDPVNPSEIQKAKKYIEASQDKIKQIKLNNTQSTEPNT